MELEPCRCGNTEPDHDSEPGLSTKYVFCAECGRSGPYPDPDGSLWNADMRAFRGTAYDSKADTLEHIQNVRDGIGHVIKELVYRAEIHDRTKLGPAEKDLFDEYTPKLKGVTYGSPEYKQFLVELAPALKHHYANHRHHPEFFGESGFRGMNLVDMLEMMIDWHASTKRHADGDLRRSVEANQERFGYSDDVKAVLHNTAEWLIGQDG